MGTPQNRSSKESISGAGVGRGKSMAEKMRMEAEGVREPAKRKGNSAMMSG